MGRRRRRTNRAVPPAAGIAGALYPTLDLHGMTEVEAERATRRWLEERHRVGDPVVRVITGRGMHSIGPPVLPGVVAGVLDDLKSGIVRSYETEPGGGVYRIRLAARRNRTVEPSRAGPIPPELVRQAEESLAELGIEPTPALIEAEVRRILRSRGRDTP